MCDAHRESVRSDWVCFYVLFGQKRSFLERADGVNIPCEDLVRGGACCKEALLKFLGTAVAHFPSRNTHGQAEM